MRKPIHTILNTLDKTYVIFKNGTIVLLSEAIKSRKTLLPQDVISESEETIMDVFHTKFKNKEYVGLLLKTAESNYFTFTTFDDATQKNFERILLKRKDAKLIGCVLHSSNKDVQLFCLCKLSDSKF